MVLLEVMIKPDNLEKTVNFFQIGKKKILQSA